MEFSILIAILWTAALFATAFILVALEFWAKDWAKKRGFPRRRFPSGGKVPKDADCTIPEEVITDTIRRANRAVGLKDLRENKDPDCLLDFRGIKEVDQYLDELVAKRQANLTKATEVKDQRLARVSREQGRSASKKLDEFKLIFSSGLDLWRGVVRLCKNLENLRK